MQDCGYERLSQQDSMYLMFETPSVHMHIGGTAIFEAKPLCRTDGGLDIDRIRAHIASRLHLAPRCRQKLAYTPIQKSWIWIDDSEFDLSCHVQHTSLPKPGTNDQLKALAGHVFSQPLRRDKPLWEIWVVEGLADDRFAMIWKTHHSVMDGKSGVSFAAVLMSASAKDTDVKEAPVWVPRRPPQGFEIVRDEALRRLALPKHALEALRETFPDAQHIMELAKDAARAIRRTLDAGFRRCAKTPLNQEIGPQRRVDWTSFSIDEMLGIQKRFGGTLNDILLATVAGALHRFLERRGVHLEGLDFKVVIPVDVRRAEDRTSANCVSMWMLELPIAEKDPVRRLLQVCKTSHHSRVVHLERGLALISQANEWLGIRILTLAGVGVVNRAKPYNLLVTNVPGPSFPLYQLGAQLLEVYPHAPLFHDQGLAIALFSYCGRVHCGLIGDWDELPDLCRFVGDLEAAYQELRAEAGCSEAAHAQATASLRKRKTQSKRVHSKPKSKSKSSEKASKAAASTGSHASAATAVARSSRENAEPASSENDDTVVRRSPREHANSDSSDPS